MKKRTHNLILTILVLTGSQVAKAELLTNGDFSEGEDMKAGWTTFLNVFDASGETFKFGTAWDTETADILTGTLTLEAHPGWTDDGNGPADLGDVIENNFYVDFGGDPEFAGEEVTFSGTFMEVEAPGEETQAMAFIKVLDGTWGLAEFLTEDVEASEDGSFSLTATVPTEDMNAFQVGFLVIGPAGSEGAILVDDLALVGSAGENLLENPGFTEGEDGKAGWTTFLNVFDPSGETYKFGTPWETDTAVVNPNMLNLSIHPGWTDDGNGPADLGDVIENNFYVDFGGAPDFAGEEVVFSGQFAVGTPFGEGNSGIAFIKVLDGAWGLAEFLTADVAADGSFSLATTVPEENMNAFQVGFAVTGTAGTDGSLLAWDLSLDLAGDPPAPLPWADVEEGEERVSNWFGSFKMGSSDWLQHNELGWIYMGLVESETDMWFSSLFLDSWLWSQRGTFPVAYEVSGDRWVYYIILPEVGAFLFDYATGNWEMVE